MQTREEKLEYGRLWRQENRDRMRAYRSAYRARNLPEHNARNKAWREANAERHKEMKALWYQTNKDRAKATARRNTLRRQYNMTLDQFENMFMEQGCKCAICKSTEPCGKGWHIDHCHSTNQVRGILCNHCNLMLGYARDNINSLREAVKYLGGDACLSLQT